MSVVTSRREANVATGRQPEGDAVPRPRREQRAEVDDAAEVGGPQQHRGELRLDRPGEEVRRQFGRHVEDPERDEQERARRATATARERGRIRSSRGGCLRRFWIAAARAAVMLSPGSRGTPRHARIYDRGGRQASPKHRATDAAGVGPDDVRRSGRYRVTGAPVTASRSIRSAARTVPRDACIRAAIAGHPRPERRVGQQRVDRARQLLVGEVVGRQPPAEPRLVHALGVVDLVPEQRQHDHRLAVVEATRPRCCCRRG